MVKKKTDILVPNRNPNQGVIPILSNQLLQAIKGTADLIVVADQNGNVTFANLALLSAVGQSEADFVGKPFVSVLSPNNSPHLTRELSSKLQEPSAWQAECLLRRRSGDDFWVSLGMTPMKGGAGAPSGSLVIGRDISEQKHAEEMLRQSEAQFRDLAEHIRVVFFVSTPHPFAITYISPAYDHIWGMPRQQVYDRPTAWIESVHPDDRERVLGVLASSQSGSETYMEYRIVRPDGSIRWISNPAYPVRDSQGKFVRVVGIAEDVTDRIRREKELEEAHRKLNAALSQSDQVARETAKLSELVDILQSCQNLEEAYKIIQRALQSILPSRSGALCITSPSRNVVEAVITWGDVAASDRTFRPDDCWALRRGKVHEVRDADSPVRCGHVSTAPVGGYLCVPLAAQGETLGVLYLESSSVPERPGADGAAAYDETPGRLATAVAERISLAIANLRLRQILRGQSIRDPLTGLFNRRYMEESLEREISRAARNQESVAVLMLDIDHFKRFNDTFGHQAADKLLQAVGELLSERTRGQDVACRYGGEEFALILSGATLEAARRRAELLQRDLKHLNVEHAGQILERITMSVGVAAAQGHDADAADLVRKADQALYRAKAEGRDCVVNA